MLHQLAYILVGIFFYAVSIAVLSKESRVSWKQATVGWMVVLLTNWFLPWYLPMRILFGIIVAIGTAAGVTVFSPKDADYKIGRFRKVETSYSRRKYRYRRNRNDRFKR